MPVYRIHRVPQAGTLDYPAVADAVSPRAHPHQDRFDMAGFGREILEKEGIHAI